MITPPLLAKGNTVGIVSTARKISKLELAPLLQLLTDWGLHYRLGNTIDAEDHQYAGNDALRARDFQEMMDDPSIHAIWCARGGYGTVRIIDALDFSNFEQHPKWIIGYSDVTVLHSHVHNLGIETLHANMAIEIDAKTEATRSGIRNVLFGQSHRIQYEMKSDFHRKGMADGKLVGGNLSLLYALLGSPSDIETDGKILFIEDLDEMLYHIDRMIQNLKRNGKLKHIKALIVGGMNDMKDNTIPFGKTAEEIIWEAVNEYDYPICFGFPAGHIQDNQPLVLGRTVRLQVEDSGVSLQF
ncbi:LD-carboxypeptidase [Aureisphaera galaxeae]|uniref:S66 peptidase family protein n=1 Tax=Aureisphaera galaxeae TaxID=1538023 RepID=UPI002350FCAE|nr:LD-carboxypeptidase [Aureisphaera galaxeae]MDC8006024.1 LD-carboxypeptidase [Aureisphaera galaxeae]